MNLLVVLLINLMKTGIGQWKYRTLKPFHVVTFDQSLQ